MLPLIFECLAVDAVIFLLRAYIDPENPDLLVLKIEVRMKHCAHDLCVHPALALENVSYQCEKYPVQLILNTVIFYTGDLFLA